MQIQFELQPDDFRAFNLFHHANSPAIRRKLLRAWIGIPVFVTLSLLLVPLLGAGNAQSYSQKLAALWWLFLFPPCFLVLIPIIAQKRLSRLVGQMLSEGRNRGLFGPRTVRIEPDRITSESIGSLTSTQWNCVERIATSPDHAFVYISALAAIIIPRRAFPAAAEFHQFADLAQAHLASSESSVSPFPEVRLRR